MWSHSYKWNLPKLHLWRWEANHLLYSFNDTSCNFNHLPQPQFETYLCKLCENNSHYGYDCPPQFPSVYEQEPSYNQNYNDNYYPYDLPSFFCCDNCRGIYQFSKLESSYLLQQDEQHSVQYKEYLKNSSNAIATSNFNQEKENQPQDSDILQLVKEECGIKVCEDQKQNMEDTMLELLKVCLQKEFYCMHKDVDDLIESALNSKLLSINLRSQHLDRKKQEVKNIVEQPTKRGTLHAITPILPIKKPEYSLSMRYEHPSIIPETESDEVIKSSAKNLVPTQFDYLEEFSGELMPTSIIDEERIKREHEEYISLMEKLFTINSFPRPMENFHANTIVETLPTSLIPVEDGDSQREEIDIFTSTDDLLPPGIESDDYDSEGDIYFLEELLFDDSIFLPENESFNFDHHDDQSFSRPPLEPPDVEFEPNSGEVISAVINNELYKDEFFDAGGEINVFANVEDDDYFPFIFVIRIFLPYLIFLEVFPLLLSTGSEDTIFDPGISV
nr:hypothetical protein [Tanacetum cinerariifolium]